MAKVSKESVEKVMDEIKKREMSAADCAALLNVTENYATQIMSTLAKEEKVTIVDKFTVRSGRRLANKFIYGEKKPELYTRHVHIMQDDDLNPRPPKPVVRVRRDPFDELFFGKPSV